MFCSKCGTQINKDNTYCPKCGAKNENCVDIKCKATSPSGNQSQNVSRTSFHVLRTKVVVGAAITCVCIVAVIIGISSVIKLGGNSTLTSDKVSFSPQGLTGYISKDQAVSFIESSEVISYSDPTIAAQTTPDHTVKVVLRETKQLFIYDEANPDGICIATDVKSINATNNSIVYYTAGDNGHLFVYDFKKKETQDIGFEEGSLFFSNGKNTVVSINASGELISYSYLNSEQKTLCNIGTDAEIICVADDGSNLFWSSKSSNVFSVYMLKSGVPERIGKITNSEKYSSVYGYYYDNDKSCLLYSPESSQVIWYKNGNLSELILPGTTTYAKIVNTNGDYIDSNDDIINEFFISVNKNKNLNQSTLYKLSLDGSFSVIVDNIKDSSYYLSSNKVFYINSDNDLYVKIVDSEGEGERITTEVERLYLSPNGKYVYLTKSGGLYYYSVTDKSVELKLISSKFSDDESVYISDADDIIFFLSDMKKVTDSYRSHGTLYRYKVGELPVSITSNVFDVLTNDTKYCSADNPVIRRYVSNMEHDYIVDYGTFSNGTYVTLLSDIKY